jgi:hypothetical protein
MHRLFTLLISTLLFSVVSFGKTPGKPFVNTGTITLSDGKQLSIDVTDNTVTVKRLNTDGSLDISFGNNGLTTELVGGRQPTFSFGYIQQDGKIDIIGYTWAGYFTWFVLRLNPDGTKDAFNYSGFGTQNVFPVAATMDCEGRLIIVGNESHDIAWNFGVTIYNPDLSVNKVFSADFSTYIPIGGLPMSNDIPNAVYSINDNRILVTGTADGVYAEAVYGWNASLNEFVFFNQYKGTHQAYLPYIDAPAAVVVSTDQNSCTASHVSLGSPSVLVPCYQSLTNNAPAVFQPGTTTVTWTLKDINGLTNTATQQVTVNDSVPPHLEASAAVSYCIDPSGSYTIARPRYSDNCSLAGISYRVTGATTRSATGDDASGVFNPGTSTITWLVVDGSGNTTTAETLVNIGSGSLQGSITTLKALEQGDENTVYVGYQPAASITLTAAIQGDNKAASYLWNNGATTPTITVSPLVTTNYSVTVTNSTGCTIQLSRNIQVVDVRCGNKMDKVALCKNGNQVCVSGNAVPAQLRSGASLGDCNNTRHNSKESLKQSTGKYALTVNVLSNPSPSYFILNVDSKLRTPISLRLISPEGKVLEQRTLSNSQSIQIGNDYRPGLYYAIVIQGSESVVVKLVKLKE